MKEIPQDFFGGVTVVDGEIFIVCGHVNSDEAIMVRPERIFDIIDFIREHTIIRVH